MMIYLAKELYPINRYLTGDGVRKTLDLIKKNSFKKKYLTYENLISNNLLS